MRIVPLLPSSCDPAPWPASEPVELAWDGRLDPGWGSAQVHAWHLPPTPWGPALGQTVLDRLRTAPEVDFLVLRAGIPGDRAEASRFLGTLEAILELAREPGVKVALRPAPGAAPDLVRRLREVHGEAVGFCWDAEVAGDLECIADRLFCAVGRPDDDFRPIQRLGYRWNVAIPARDPAAHRALAERLALAFPPVLRPAPTLTEEQS